MKNSNINFSVLWIKIQGSLNPKDSEIFEDWLAESKENRAYFERLRDYCHNSRQVTQERQEDAWMAVNRQIQLSPIPKYTRNRSRVKVISGIAATILLLFGISVLWTYLQKQEEPTELAVVEVPVITPGTSKATLITTNGKSIELSKDQDLQIMDHDVAIQSFGSKLTYTGGSVDRKEIEQFNTLVVPRGGEYKLVLSDSTKVWLNSETTLRYPIVFKTGKRTVELTGEAYFEVASNVEQPFEVVTVGQTITVLGTSFNVSAYESNANEVTTLVEGKIQAITDVGQSQIILPGNQVLYSRQFGEMLYHKVDTEVYTNWKDGLFTFEDKRLDAIMTTLARWYDVNVFYENDAAASIRFTGQVKRYDEVQNILELIEITKAVKFETSGKAIIIK